MSDAILCDDIHLERKVVVKRLKDGVDQSRILDELSALQSIRSKHVVQIFDVVRAPDGAVLAIVQEYIPGNDLTKLSPPSSPDELFKILYPIAEGIRDIHAHGRIHRDIKRQNMKYDAEGCLKIFDFGLARDAASASTVGEKGTPGYMAPELFETTPGKTVSFTKAIDVFAFAATALAIVLGKVPKGLREAPPNLPCPDADFSKLPLVLSAEVAGALNLCLSATPSIRPTMDHLTNLFAAYLLRDQHRALLVSGGSTYILNDSQRDVQLAAKGLGNIDLHYDGLRFVVTSLGGDVAINNMAVVAGFILPGSCVIALGSNDIGPKRVFITVDVSHPEVVI
jgi:serine/threonine protein kinase